MASLGFDPTRGTIGASGLGDVAGPDRSSREAGPLRKCAYVIVGDDGKVVGTCGTILREGNHGCFCTIHTSIKRKGEKYTNSVAVRRRKRMHIVRT
jgi:hypothetical protein